MIPYEIAAGSPLILQLGPTRSEHLNRQSRGTAGLRLYGQDVTLRKEYRESKKSYFRQPLPTLEETVDFHFRPPIITGSLVSPIRLTRPTTPTIRLLSSSISSNRSKDNHHPIRGSRPRTFQSFQSMLPEVNRIAPIRHEYPGFHVFRSG